MYVSISDIHVHVARTIGWGSRPCQPEVGITPPPPHLSGWKYYLSWPLQYSFFTTVTTAVHLAPYTDMYHSAHIVNMHSGLLLNVHIMPYAKTNSAHHMCRKIQSHTFNTGNVYLTKQRMQFTTHKIGYMYIYITLNAICQF